MDNCRALSGGWDVHTHIIPPGVVAAGERGAFGMSRTGGALTICAHGVPVHPISETAKLVERVRADRLDGAIVSVPPPLFRPDLAATERADYARLVNDALDDACHNHPDTLRPLAYLPIESPDVAARLAAELDGRWAGIVVGTENAELFSSAELEPLWAILSARALPMFVHPGSTPDRRLDAFYLANLLGNPVETTIVAAHLIFAGVPQRFPDLKVILAHGGGCVAALCGRWQRGVVTNRPDVPRLRAPPLEAVRRIYVDSLVHSPIYLDAIIKTLGADRVLLGSDWPFPMGAPSADHDLGCLAPELAHRIRTANAEAVFGRRLQPARSTPVDPCPRGKS